MKKLRITNHLLKNPLLNPKIIILGDSMAMGWGVSDDQIFTTELNNNG